MRDRTRMTLKYGRKPRIHDPRVPKMSAVLKAAPTLPPAVNYDAGMPANLGVMLNDSLGCCVESAAGHAIQVWSYNASGTMVTPSDADIEAFYEWAGGYVPGDPSTDNGTVMQVALSDWLKGKGPLDTNRLSAYVEIDQLTASNIRQSIYESGLAYIGFNCPSFFQNLESPGSVWDVDPSGDQSIIGGHCVPLVGYNATKKTYTLISWGSIYTMTQAFFDAFCDEAYILADPAWIESTGKTLLGLTLAELEALMSEITGTPVVSNRRRHRHHRRVHRRQI